jgi:hypothetical protein
MTYVCAAGQSAGRASSSTASGGRGAQLVFVCRRRPTPRPLLFLLLRSPGTKITGHVALIQRQGCRCAAWGRRRDRKRSRARPALDDDTWARERPAFTCTQAPVRSIGHCNPVLPFCYIQYAHGRVAKRYSSSLPRPSPRLPPDGPLSKLSTDHAQAVAGAAFHRQARRTVAWAPPRTVGPQICKLCTPCMCEVLSANRCRTWPLTAGCARFEYVRLHYSLPGAVISSTGGYEYVRKGVPG